MLGHQKFSQFLSVLGDEMILCIISSHTWSENFSTDLHTMGLLHFFPRFCAKLPSAITSFTGGEKRSATAPLQISMFCIPLLWLLCGTLFRKPTLCPKIQNAEKLHELSIWIFGTKLTNFSGEILKYMNCRALIGQNQSFSRLNFWSKSRFLAWKIQLFHTF